MRCEQASELMSLRLDRFAIDDNSLDNHLLTCPMCRAEWTALQRVSRLLDSPPLVYPPADFTLRVMARVAQRPAPVTRYNPWRLLGGWFVLMFGAILIGLGLLSPFAVAAWQAWGQGLTFDGPATLVNLGWQAQAVVLAILKAVENILAFIPTPVLVGYMLTALLLMTVWVAILGHVHFQRVEHRV